MCERGGLDRTDLGFSLQAEVLIPSIAKRCQSIAYRLVVYASDGELMTGIGCLF